MKHSLLFLLGFLVIGNAFSGLYKWVDEEGNVHYGDSPPAGDKSQEITLPSGPKEEDVQESQRKFKELLERKERSDQIHSEEKEKKKEEKAAKKKLKLEYKRRCIRARQNLHTLLQRRPVYSINEKGERVFINNTSREDQISRMKKEIEMYCK